MWLGTGLELNPRVLKFSHLDATYNPSSISIRPMALFQAVIHLTGPSAEHFNATTATQVVNAIRTRLVGTIASDITLGYYANDLQVQQLSAPDFCVPMYAPEFNGLAYCSPGVAHPEP